MIAMTGHPSPAPSPSRGEGFLFALAGWAVERAALARQAADGAHAPGRARQPGVVVHLMPLPIVPLRPIRRQEIADAGASIRDGLAQDISHRVVEAPDSPDLQAARHPIGMQATAIQYLIRIDVADTGDDLPVNYQGLEAPAPARHHRPEVFPGHRQRIAPEPPRGKTRQARP